MGFQYVGLVCLILGMGAFFLLWLHAISDRTKTLESDTPPADPQPFNTQQSSVDGYSLSPQQRRSPVGAGAPIAARSDDELAVSSEVQVTQLSVTVDTGDETVNTHLELASQFFDMGDFEGTEEMCQLVLDNPKASGFQTAAAMELKARC